MIEKLSVTTKRQGLQEITASVAKCVSKSPTADGLCTLFIQHTSASLIIQENFDRTARNDLETFLNKLVPENDPSYTHTAEGPDDMPSHIKAALTQVSVVIPFQNRKLLLGTWQGIYLWEHRRSS